MGQGGSDHLRRNRALWTRWAASHPAEGERSWARAEPAWGIWRVPEARLGVLPARLAGRDAIELGCGTAYVSAWLARRGARAVGLDPTPAQLARARMLQRAHGLAFPLVEGDAEAVPCRDARFDLAISEYGACLWADPARWVAEAARILRPGGELIFLTSSALLALCAAEEDEVPAGERLLRPAFGMYRVEWAGDPEAGVEFHLSHGDWLRLLCRHGFVVEDLLEVQPPADAVTDYRFVDLAWARRWPCEEVWKARRR